MCRQGTEEGWAPALAAARWSIAVVLQQQSTIVVTSVAIGHTIDHRPE
jgi:hypothetical protein